MYHEASRVEYYPKTMKKSYRFFFSLLTELAWYGTDKLLRFLTNFYLFLLELNMRIGTIYASTLHFGSAHVRVVCYAKLQFKYVVVKNVNAIIVEA